MTDSNPLDAMITDYRTMCAELLEALEIQLDELRFNNRLCIRARALLDQPVAEGPTDEELLELMPQQFRNDLATVSRMAAMHPTVGPDVTPGIFRVTLNTGALEYARAVLAKWGHQ